MKIKAIALKNIGPYVGENSFDFSTDDHNKNMILIGGKNGAGKTTLFNAIKTCLYGCVAYGFESSNTRYYHEIEKILNENEKHKKGGQAQIVIKLVFDDGKDNHIYTFDRSWRITGKRIVEQFDLYKDSALLSQTDKGDFENYLLQILPPNLFRFYFFDGERISDFVFNNNNNSDFKDAFLKLCNLDTMEIIKENFKRVSRAKTKGNNNVEYEYEKCIEADNLFADRVFAAEEEYKEITFEIAQIDDKLSSLEKAYAKSGGITKKEWKGMQEQIAKEELRRNNQRKWLKDVANNVLPFIILRSQLEDLKTQITTEHKAQLDANMKTMIRTPEIKTIIENVLSSVGIELANDVSERIIYEISGYSDASSEIKPVLNLSDNDRFELIGKINSLLAFDTGRIKSATKDIDASLNHVKRIRKKMERSSVENYEDYLQQKSDLNEKRSELTQSLLDIDRELQEYRAQKAISSSNLIKAKSNYEAYLKKRSINDISARALLAFDELESLLYRRSIRLVEEEFKMSFSALINKPDLIDGIHIDENLNVIPYKNTTFSISELKQIIDKNGEEHLIAQIGLYAYEVFMGLDDPSNSIVVLPVEVKKQLSAGEKQIFIMALYQALAKLNKIDVPYIIDTPFARIDKDHREKILEHFFMKLNGQVIVLSTDEEIVGEYQEIIHDAVSDTFVLQHTETGTTKVLANTYFGGAL
ncbi:MAG: AAA family ATPase [Ruminococcus sp.]|nr:AAA family ATPase [Ruminococcus sp.]